MQFVNNGGWVGWKAGRSGHLDLSSTKVCQKVETGLNPWSSLCIAHWTSNPLSMACPVSSAYLHS